MRRSIKETWEVLNSNGLKAPIRPDGEPLVPDCIPCYDDEELGLSIFKTEIVSEDLSGLSMPRTYFARSLISRVSFQNTDLTESNMCWNDFNECDFSGAILKSCDMRASGFIKCDFTGAVLRGADLRRSHFDKCKFSDADFSRTMVNVKQEKMFNLSFSQAIRARWRWFLGNEPEGG